MCKPIGSIIKWGITIPISRNWKGTCTIYAYLIWYITTINRRRWIVTIWIWSAKKCETKNLKSLTHIHNHNYLLVSYYYLIIPISSTVVTLRTLPSGGCSLKLNIVINSVLPLLIVHNQIRLKDCICRQKAVLWRKETINQTTQKRTNTIEKQSISLWFAFFVLVSKNESKNRFGMSLDVNMGLNWTPENWSTPDAIAICCLSFYYSGNWESSTKIEKWIAKYNVVSCARRTDYFPCF